MEMSPPFTNHFSAQTDYLADIGQQLLDTWRQRESGQTLAQVLDEVVQQTHAFFPNQVVLVSLYIYRETGLLYLERVDGELVSIIKTTTSHPRGAAALLVNQRRPVFVETLAQWPATLPPIAEHLVNTGKIQAYVGLPLVIGRQGQEEVVGALLISLRSPQHFDPVRRHALERWAQQVALFVQNARVLRRRRREEEAFQAISASASSGNPDEVGTVIARQVRELTKSAFVAVLAHRPQARRLESCGVALYGSAERTGVIQLALDKPSINAHVLQTQQPYYAPDLRQDAHHLIYQGWDEAMYAAYCVPLLIQQQVIGTLYVTSQEIDGIGLDDRNFLEKLAPQAAIALHLATLMQQERTQRAYQAQELAEVRDYAITNEAVAWFGITAADRQHTLAQKIGSIRYCTDTLRVWAQQHQLAGDECINEIIEDLNSVADDIQAIKRMSATAAPTEAPTLIDRELRRSVQRWCDDYNREGSSTIRCQFVLTCDELQVHVPTNILRIAAEKVVHNALQAMATDGLLTVHSRRIGDQIAVDFTDDGPGIPAFARPDFLKRPIQRPPSIEGQGTGMGAQMARLVARRYRGDLALLATGAAGTTIRLTFPVYVPAVQETAPEKLPVEKSSVEKSPLQVQA